MPANPTFLAKALRKAILAERAAARHSERLAALTGDDATRRQLLAEAREELRHARTLERAAARDGIDLGLAELGDGGPDPQLVAIGTAFDALCDRGEQAAASFLHDVVIEHVAVHLYGAIRDAAVAAGSRAVARCVPPIVRDEQAHVDAAVDALAALSAAERARAMAVAWEVFEPILDAWGRVAPGTPCARPCASCAGRCMQRDAAAAGLDLAGGTERLLARIVASVGRILEGAEGASCAA